MSRRRRDRTAELIEMAEDVAHQLRVAARRFAEAVRANVAETERATGDGGDDGEADR
jgi:hypothetical protein